jgi:hypothetical protein
MAPARCSPFWTRGLHACVACPTSLPHVPMHSCRWGDTQARPPALALTLPCLSPAPLRARARLPWTPEQSSTPLHLCPSLCSIACTITSTSLLSSPLVCLPVYAPPRTIGSSPPPGYRHCGCPCVRSVGLGSSSIKPRTYSVPRGSGGASVPLLSSHHRRQQSCRRASTVCGSRDA